MPIISLILGGLQSFLSAAFTFLTTKPGVYLLIAGIAAGAYWYSGHEGYARAKADDAAAYALALSEAQTAAYQKGLALQQKLDNGLQAAGYKAGLAAGKEQAKTVTVTKWIHDHVTPAIDKSFPIPCSLVRAHDAAAAGIQAEAVNLPGSPADDAACPTQASDLADVIAFNYGLDRQKDTQIIGLQDTVNQLVKALNDGG